MILIDVVASLQELPGRRNAIIEREKDTRTPNYAILERIDIEQKLLNATPDLLEVLAGFQPGDAKRVQRMVEAMELGKVMWPQDKEFDTDIEVLNRLLDMARLMEASGK